MGERMTEEREADLRKRAEAVLALLDELDDLRAERELRDNLGEMFSDLLNRTANALKGEPKALHGHDWSDLPLVASQMVARLRDAERVMDAATSILDDVYFVEDRGQHPVSEIKLRSLEAALAAWRKGASDAN